MAAKGSRKELSVRHEDAVATAYKGRRSASSGAAVHDAGDVRVGDENTLFECKAKFGLLVGAVPVKSTIVKQMEKIADEAYAEGRDPALALRFYCPESPLADREGWVDLTVRLLGDDAQRSEMVREGCTCHSS